MRVSFYCGLVVAALASTQSLAVTITSDHSLADDNQPTAATQIETDNEFLGGLMDMGKSLIGGAASALGVGGGDKKEEAGA